MFEVRENNKPCDADHFPVSAIFNNGRFDTLDQAIGYLNLWLGDYGPVSEDFKVGDVFDYSGYGDVVTIVEVFS